MSTMRAISLLLLAGACRTNETPLPEPSPVLPTCVPNRTGGITAAELPVAIGATLAYYTGDNRTIDQSAADGVWDLSEERSDDKVIALGPTALREQWYASMYPAGQFVVDAGEGLEGIYHQDDRALWLDGIASHDDAPPTGKTLIVYPQPLTALRFPIVAGDRFSSSATFVATINGLPFNGTDELDADVADESELDLPYVHFDPVLRVRTQAVRKPSSGGIATRRTTAWMFECFGEVAHADSKLDEANADFTTAATLRRFALGATP